MTIPGVFQQPARIQKGTVAKIMAGPDSRVSDGIHPKHQTNDPTPEKIDTQRGFEGCGPSQNPFSGFILGRHEPELWGF